MLTIFIVTVSPIYGMHDVTSKSKRLVPSSIVIHSVYNMVHSVSNIVKLYAFDLTFKPKYLVPSCTASLIYLVLR